ncbi:MAG: BrnT family toxin [Elusimicrobiota bacterium]
METIPIPIEFEWDKNNTKHIKERHRIEPYECEQVFFDVFFIISPDSKHSQQEQRYLVSGRAKSGKVIIVVFTIRKDKIRVITARPADGKERRIYHGTQKIKGDTEI